jgi:hypothetical protein
MAYDLTQDQQFIKDVRDFSSVLLQVADKGLALQEEWNSNFGGAGRLQSGSFLGNDSGLNKTDISNGLSVIYGLNAWLDTNTQRVEVEKLRQ